MYSIRPATAEDLEPMMTIGHEGIRPYVEALWGWVQADQERAFRDQFTLQDISIVEIAGISVGYLKIEEHHDHIFLAGIYLGAEHRGSGLGTEVMRGVIQQARERRKQIRLRVLRSNPARHLYGRLGFRETECTATHVHMEFNASAA